MSAFDREGDVQLDAQEPAREQPEHHGERRRFLIWALMLGATTPERVAERVVAEVEREADA